jgi:hypothetical protein
LTIKYGKPPIEWVNPADGLTLVVQGKLRTTAWLVDLHTCAQLSEKLVPDMTAAEAVRGLIVIMYSDCLAEGTEGL